jgi:hypothetical protein
MVKAQRRRLPQTRLRGKSRRSPSEAISASLDYYRSVRDATSEAMFFQTYGNVFSLYMGDKHEADARLAGSIADSRELPFVKEALASIEEGRVPPRHWREWAPCLHSVARRCRSPVSRSSRSSSANMAGCFPR